MPAESSRTSGMREAGPQLVLELLEDVLRGDDEDALAPAAADQLGEDQPISRVLPSPTTSAISSAGGPQRLERQLAPGAAGS